MQLGASGFSLEGVPVLRTCALSGSVPADSSGTRLDVEMFVCLPHIAGMRFFDASHVVRLLTCSLVIGTPALLHAQPSCPASQLHAYAHNDYENDEPLTEAMALGYRGVEADVFLVEGQLRLGHDRRAARRGLTLEEVYLEPLRELAARCGSLTAHGRGLLLALEIKETSPVTFDSLSALLGRYADLLRPPRRDSMRPAPVEVVLVGWHPPEAELVQSGFSFASLQQLVTTREVTAPDSVDLVRLVSLDYGKTMGRWFTRASERRQWMATALAIKAQSPGRFLRVFNVPLDEETYRGLLNAGVDLIGTKSIRRSQEFLRE